MQNSFQIQIQPDDNWALTFIGTYSNNVWAIKYYNLTAEEIGQLLGGN